MFDRILLEKILLFCTTYVLFSRRQVVLFLIFRYTSVYFECHFSLGICVPLVFLASISNGNSNSIFLSHVRLSLLSYAV